MGEMRLVPGSPLKIEGLGFALASDSVVADVRTAPLVGPLEGWRRGEVLIPAEAMAEAQMEDLGAAFLDVKSADERGGRVSAYAESVGEDEGRLLLYCDENGVVTVHVPEPEAHLETAWGGPARGGLRFDIPLRPAAEPPGDVAAVAGRWGGPRETILNLIGWKVVGGLVSSFGPQLVRSLWESRSGPMRIVTGEAMFEEQAPAMAGKIPPGDDGLLFIHGTFSRTAKGFKGVGNTAFLSSMSQRYGDRIYGFDHATVATGIATNVMQFYDQLAPGRHVFDVICHSRGGLVARAMRDLSEAQLKERFELDCQRGNYGKAFIKSFDGWSGSGVDLEIRRIIFAGSPNRGTMIAAPQRTYLKKLLDILITASNLLPGAEAISIGGVLTLAKVLMNEAIPKLPGLDDIHPESSLLGLLGDAPAAEDAAVWADFEPGPGTKVPYYVGDLLLDPVFRGEPNDMAVRGASVSDWPGGSFDPTRKLFFEPEKAVWHCTLFAQSETRDRIPEWLGLG